MKITNLRRYLWEESASHETTPDEILGRLRTANVAKARRKVMQRLYADGMPLSRIAGIFSVDHSTVVYATSSDYRSRHRRSMLERYYGLR